MGSCSMTGDIQGDLFATSARGAEERLRRHLAEACDCRVELILTRNRTSMASLRYISDSHVRLRLHQQFLNAPPEVWKALTEYIRTRKKSCWQVVADFASTIDISSERHVATPSRLKTRGNVYDLRVLAREVNQQYFMGRIKYKIGWGAYGGKSKGGRGISIRYGSWNPQTKIIRIHPLLDDKRVPRRFVEYVIFHEMLHAVVPCRHVDGRRLDHHADFKKLERKFPGYQEMQQLSKRLLDVLKR